MKKKLILSPWFLLALTLLLLNDFVFKELYGNFLTGKISDFTGLFVFSLFWYSLFPKRKNVIFTLTALLFIIWKSEYSQVFIDFWNDILILKINRVVDYTDLAALIILPLAYRVDKIKPKLTLEFKFSSVIVSGLALFAFASTSYYSEVEVDKKYNFKFSLDSLENKLKSIEAINHSVVREMEYHKTYPDTVPMELDIKDDFCFDGYNALITISGDSSISELWLEHFQHNCPKDDNGNSKSSNKDDYSVLLSSFENKVIRPLEKK